MKKVPPEEAYEDNLKEFQAFSSLESNELLLRFINSTQFTIYHNVEYLARYAYNIGIHYYVCENLLKFPHVELQFYISQLVQILLTVETESMVLEELILKLSSENPHFALSTYWQLHALLSDFSSDPESYGFQIARRVINKLQIVLCSTATITQEPKLNENLSPALILSSVVIGLPICPQLGLYAKPLIESQGRRQRSHVFKLAKNVMVSITKNISIHSNVNTKRLCNKRLSISPIDIIDSSKTREDALFRKPKEKPIIPLDFDIVDNIGERLFKDKLSNSIVMPKRRQRVTNQAYVHKLYKPSVHRKINSTDEYLNLMPNNHVNSAPNALLNCSRSSKNFNEQQDDPECDASSSESKKKGYVCKMSKQDANIYHLSPSNLNTTQKIKILKANYFRCEMQFAIALETISRKLAQVPAEARLTSLRAELSIMNRDLPAEVDIPILLPPNKKGKLHKILHIAANEAQILNSAEKVPFLLYIEYLRDGMDFDPSSTANETLLRERPNGGSFIFDLTNINNNNENHDLVSTTVDVSMSVMSNRHTNKNWKEIDLGDISMIRVTDQNHRDYHQQEMLASESGGVLVSDNSHFHNQELGAATNADSITERMADINLKDAAKKLPDDLATQMRISAMMLEQLDKSPQQFSGTASQIRSTIIASMQKVQDSFGYSDLEILHGMAGERKLENDLKTGGLSTNNRKHMTYLGEDWATKKDKIRKSSQYGHLENWDLCSVIAKSGGDLRQEAFACQLIQAMANIWKKEKVDVWVKKMKILITSANTGLVETITNAISIHSIKKALTKQMIEEGELDEKGTIATLSDHFVRTFGDKNSFKYRRAQDNFASSLAAYSIVCYILQIKDRHNGNIMIDNEGHVVHIDFGFMLSNSPGFVGFEVAPFKLTQEYVDLLDGLDGEPYKKFIRLIKKAFLALRKYADMLVSMCEIMQKDNSQPCFSTGDQTSVQLRQRFHLELTEEECNDFVENTLIGKSLGSIYSRLYDQFQLMTQGIYT